MALGYDGKLYILAFDHRGSFQKKMFGIEGEPDAEQTATIADAKHLIFEGMELAVERGVDAARDRRARRRAVRRRHPGAGQARGPQARDAGREERPGRVRLPVRRPSSASHIESFDPDFSKVLVRYNPDGDAETNERQLGRLKELADWLHANDRLFLFELLVPAPRTPSSSRSAATPTATTPSCARSSCAASIEDIQDFGIEVDIWKIEGVDKREDAEMLAEATRKGDGRENVKSVLLGRGASDDKVDHWLRQAAGRRGLHRLRDRPLDLVGRAQGLPRRRRRALRGGRADRRQLPALRQGLRRRRDGRARLRRRAAGPLAAIAAAAALTGCADPAAESPDGPAGRGESARVVRVVDGDTIRVRYRGAEEPVRYIGIDTPESVKPGTPVECFAKRASAFNAKLVDGERVRLVTDVEARDRYGRLLAYVYRASDDLFVNAELVRRGYATVATFPPNVRHEGLFRRLAERARMSERGLWSRCVGAGE